MGASVVLNFHVPMPSDVARAAAETASLQSLSAGQNPGTISISTTKNRKRSVACTDETLYVDNRRPLLSESLGSLVPVLESLSIAVPPRSSCPSPLSSISVLRIRPCRGEDGNVLIGVAPQGEEVSIGCAGLSLCVSVNGLVGHAYALVVGILCLQPSGNLLWRPVQHQLTRDHVPQLAVAGKKTPLRSQSGFPGLPIRIVGAIGRSAAMAPDLPAHCRRRPAEAAGYGADR
jgi:hypothetical protein